MATEIFIILIILGILILPILAFIVIYNGLVTLRNRVKNAWAQIDVQLKRRYNLIPNLIETVKGYAKHEKSVFESLKNFVEIIEIHPLFGEYDILVKIQTADIDGIGEVVIKKIRSLKGIVDTKTLIGTKSLSGET